MNERNEKDLLPCPFCHETDFDLIGLKGHLLSGYCIIFDNTKMPHEAILESRRTLREGEGKEKG